MIWRRVLKFRFKLFNPGIKKVPEILQGAPLEKGTTAVVYIGNGADKSQYAKLFKHHKLKGKAYCDIGGFYDLCAVQYVMGNASECIVHNGFSHACGSFVGFTARRRREDGWEWYGNDGKWHSLSGEHMDKRIFKDGEKLEFFVQDTPMTVLMDAQWITNDGVVLDCGYPMFTNPLMAHSFGGMNGKTYHNTLPALKQGIKNGYQYFEVDLSYTTDGRLVLCHGWTEANCKHTGFTYSPEFQDMTYNQIMGMQVHGNDIMDARQFYRYLKKYSKYTFEIDFHNISGLEMQKRVVSMLHDFKHDRKVMDRLLIQAYSRDMYESIDSIYHFKHYQYLVGKNIHDLDNIITYCLDHGICAVALRFNLAKPEFVRKIRNAGLYILCYTVNKDLTLAKNLLDSGVSTLCTDYITEDSLKHQKKGFGHYEFYVYYNSGNKEAVSAYKKLHHGSTMETVKSGALEYKDQKKWKNDGTRALRKCEFELQGKRFIGWHLRVTIDGKPLWYCKDHCYHTKGDFQPGTNVEPYLFEDEAVLPKLTLKEDIKLIMVAVWE